jgi:hypothetical protein
MDACLGDVTSLLANDRTTLEWLRDKTASIQSLRSLYQSADEAARRFSAAHGMGVYLSWNVLHESGDGGVLGLHVGGLIERKAADVDNMSYYLCISAEKKVGGRHRVLRKYHFDYASRDTRARRRSPAFHLQYGGKLSPNMRDGYQLDHMDTWLEEPRVFFLPMSLSLVLHMAFREFPDEYTNRLCEDSYWQSTVRRDQKRLIQPYLQKCLGIVTKDGLLWDVVCNG